MCCYDIQIGDKVIIRSNEIEPIMVGIVVDFENFGHSKFPIVKISETGSIVMAMGICIVYSESLLEELNSLSYKEQWNRLAKNYKKI